MIYEGKRRRLKITLRDDKWIDIADTDDAGNIATLKKDDLKFTIASLQKIQQHIEAQQQLRDEESKLRRWNMNTAQAKANKILGITKEGAK